jgi:glycerol-3-phosphate dehydrogenase
MSRWSIAASCRRSPTATARVRLEGHEQVRGYEAKGVDRLVTVLGAKYTTARGVAERVTDLVVRMLGRNAAPCRTAETPLTSAPPAGSPVNAMGSEDASRRISAESLAHLMSSYGLAFDEAPPTGARGGVVRTDRRRIAGHRR